MVLLWGFSPWLVFDEKKPIPLLISFKDEWYYFQLMQYCSWSWYWRYIHWRQKKETKLKTVIIWQERPKPADQTKCTFSLGKCGAWSRVEDSSGRKLVSVSVTPLMHEPKRNWWVQILTPHSRTECHATGHDAASLKSSDGMFYSL